MAANSSIEWTDTTWNPVVGCTMVSPGCAHCYAETMAARLKGMALADIAAGRDPGRKRHYIDAIGDNGRWSGKLIPVPEALDDVYSWRKPRRVFVNSMSDLFHESVPEDFIEQVFWSMATVPRHAFQVLTKRAERMAGVVGRLYAKWKTSFQQERDLAHWRLQPNPKQPQMPVPNVWLGVSTERQQEADERIPWLLKTPAAVRFLSCEPLIGPIDLRQTHRLTARNEDPLPRPLDKIDWVIVGGESGHGAREMDIGWVRQIANQCIQAKVPVFIKQLGREPYQIDMQGDPSVPGCTQYFVDPLGLKHKKGADMAEWPEDMRVRQFPEAVHA